MSAIAQPRRKYHFTPELHDELRRAYCGRRHELTAALHKLAWQTGWPRDVLKREAQRLGITRASSQRAWSEADLAYVREKVGVVSVNQIARHLRRSKASVTAKAERLRLSRRPQEGYTLTDLSEVFGESRHKVRRWMDRGLFGKVHKHGGRRVTEKNVLRFIRDHYYEIDLRRVDDKWFKAMVFGEYGIRANGGTI